MKYTDEEVRALVEVASKVQSWLDSGWEPNVSWEFELEEALKPFQEKP